MSATTQKVHPNLVLLGRLSDHFPYDLDNAKDLFTEDFVFHYYNTRMPELDGDYRGVDGLKAFFQKLGVVAEGTFRVEDKRLVDVGDELVATAARPRMTAEGRSFEWDALFIWRVVDNKFAEAWDIPAVNTIRDL